MDAIMELKDESDWRFFLPQGGNRPFIDLPERIGCQREWMFRAWTGE